MARNKGRSQIGQNEGRLENDKMNNDRAGRSAPLSEDEELRETVKTEKGVGRKGFSEKKTKH